MQPRDGYSRDIGGGGPHARTYHAGAVCGGAPRAYRACHWPVSLEPEVTLAEDNLAAGMEEVERGGQPTGPRLPVPVPWKKLPAPADTSMEPN